MDKDFASSSIMRQNVLNNQLAVAEMQKSIGVKGVLFEGEYKFFKKQIADFFEVTERTIESCLEKHGKELERNGYEVLRGKRLTDMKLVLQGAFGTEVDFGTKTTVLGVFNFRTFLDIAMLLTDSEKAKVLRSAILDIVIDTINKRTGGNTKYINQRDEDFVSNLTTLNLKGSDSPPSSRATSTN